VKDRIGFNVHLISGERHGYISDPVIDMHGIGFIRKVVGMGIKAVDN